MASGRSEKVVGEKNVPACFPLDTKIRVVGYDSRGSDLFLLKLLTRSRKKFLLLGVASANINIMAIVV